MKKYILVVILLVFLGGVNVSATTYNTCQQIESANTSDTKYVYKYYENGCISQKTATTVDVNDNKYEVEIQDTFYNEDGALSYTNLYTYTPFEQTQDPKTVDYVTLLTTYYPLNTFEMLEGNNASYTIETYYEDVNTLVYGDSVVVSDTETHYYENSNMYDTITINDYANNTQTNYKYDKDGFIDYKNTYYFENDVVVRSVETTYYAKYNADGEQLVKDNIDTTFVNEVATKQNVETYYESGLLKTEEYVEFNSNKTKKYETISSYNESSELVKEEEIKYDSNGVITNYEMNEYTNGILTQEYSAVYQTGLITTDTTINYENEVMQSNMVCQYSNEIKTSCIEEIYENGILVSKIEYVFDASGNVIDKIELIKPENTVAPTAVDTTNGEAVTNGEVIASFSNTGSYQRLFVLCMVFLAAGICVVIKKCRQKN